MHRVLLCLRSLNDRGSSHRHAEMHECPSLNTEKQETTVRKVPKVVAKPKLASKKPPMDPVKFAQWQKVEAMRMRHRAIPADPKDKTASLPPDQRLHVRINVGETEHVLWLRKVCIFVSTVRPNSLIQDCCNWPSIGSHCEAVEIDLF